MTMPPAGWYPDPANSDNIRYWDGQVWTDRVQPKAAPPPPPAPAPPPPSAAPVAGPQQPAAAQPGAQPYGDQPYGDQPYGDQPYGDQQPAPYGYGPQLSDPYGGYGYAPAPAPGQGQAPGRIGPDGQVLSGWWRRVGGFLIDSIIVSIPAAIAAAITTTIITANGGAIFDEAALERLVDSIEEQAPIANSDLFDVVAPGFWTVLFVSGAVWFIASMINGVYLVSRSGQTLGDRAVNTRKVMAGRTVPSVGIALGRWLIPNALFAGIGNIVPFGFLLQFINYLWPLWDNKSRTLHDMMVKTYVERSDLTGPPVSRR